jgi:hypothetical protein
MRGFLGNPGSTDPNALTSGEYTLPRHLFTSGVALASGTVRLTYFTAQKTESVGNLRTVTGSVAAGATPTLCRMGLYLEAANGDLSLVAACANDTTLFVATFAPYSRAVTTPYAKVAGRRYAFAWLVVSGATMPQIAGVGTLSGTETAAAPRLGASLASQTDLPASITAGSLSNLGTLSYGVTTP